MRAWARGAVLAMVLAGGAAPAQQPGAPPAPGASPRAAPDMSPRAAPDMSPGAVPDLSPRAVPDAPPSPAPSPGNVSGEPPAVARLRALLGPSASLAYRSAEVLDPVTGSARLLGASLARGGSRMEMAELTLDAVGEAGLGAASAREVVLSGAGRGTARVARMELRGLAAAADALALDGLRLDTLSVEGSTPFALAELVLEDYAPGRAGRLTLAGLEVLPRGQAGFDRVRLGRAALRGLDLPATVAALAARQPPPRTPGAWALEVEEVTLQQGDRRVAGLGTLRLQGDPPQGAVESGRLALRELRLEPSPGLDLWLQRLGLPALVADVTTESRYDRGSGRFELGALSIAARELGALGLSLTLDGLTPKAAQAGDWETLGLAGLTLRYLDASLYARLLRDQARRLRQPEARLREQYAGQAAAVLPGGPGEGGAVLAAVQRFLRGEAKELVVTAAPPKPIPLGDLPVAAMGGAAAMQRALGLAAVAR